MSKKIKEIHTLGDSNVCIQGSMCLCVWGGMMDIWAKEYKRLRMKMIDIYRSRTEGGGKVEDANHLENLWTVSACVSRQK